MNFDSVLDEIKRRDWDKIKHEWLRFIPMIQIPGSHPIENIEELSEFNIIASDIIANGFIPQNEEITSIKLTLFWEATYLLHRASHVLSSTENLISLGIKTWALSNAYQSALFSAKAIINFLGVSFPSYENKPFLIDVWPPPLSSYNRQSHSQNYSYAGINFFYLGLGGEVQHRHIWSALQRILRVSRIDIIPTELIKYILKLKINEYARQRNYLHYQNKEWLFDDLYNYNFDPLFGIRSKDFYKALQFKDIRSDFSIILAQALLKFAVTLFNSIAVETNKLEKEKNLLMSSIQDSFFHPVYVQNML